MLAPRFLCWLIILCTLAVGQTSFSANAPLWQPYRQLAAQPAIAPAPQTVYVPAAQVTSVPVDAITDADLAHLCPPETCEEYYPTANTFVDPVIGVPLVDPVVASAARPTTFELLPSDVIWHSYWAGAKEPRTSAVVFEEFGDSLSLLDVSLGGRTTMFRNASRNAQGQWNGWELQIEGAGMLRLNLDNNWDFDAADFRFGVPLILARNELLWKIAYYHLSSHVGDEFLVRNPGFMRINYSRDVMVLGGSYSPRPAWRWYGEVGYAFVESEGAEPWEFQFGVDFAQPGATGSRGTPFFALNGHLREEVDYGGNLAVQAGWLWRGDTGRVMRTGLHYYNGKSSQFEFFDNFEQQLGIGLWQEY